LAHCFELELEFELQFEPESGSLSSWWPFGHCCAGEPEGAHQRQPKQAQSNGTPEGTGSAPLRVVKSFCARDLHMHFSLACPLRPFECAQHTDPFKPGFWPRLASTHSLARLVRWLSLICTKLRTPLGPAHRSELACLAAGGAKRPANQTGGWLAAVLAVCAPLCAPMHWPTAAADSLRPHTRTEALHCARTALHCIGLQCTAMQCTPMHSNALDCIGIQRNAPECGPLQPPSRPKINFPPPNLGPDTIRGTGAAPETV